MPLEWQIDKLKVFSSSIACRECLRILRSYWAQPHLTKCDPRFFGSVDSVSFTMRPSLGCYLLKKPLNRDSKHLLGAATRRNKFPRLSFSQFNLPLIETEKRLNTVYLMFRHQQVIGTIRGHFWPPTFHDDRSVYSWGVLYWTLW